MQYTRRRYRARSTAATAKVSSTSTLYQAIPTNLAAFAVPKVQVDTVGVKFALHFHPGHLNHGNFAGMWYGIIGALVKSDAPPKQSTSQDGQDTRSPSQQIPGDDRPRTSEDAVGAIQDGGADT